MRTWRRIAVLSGILFIAALTASGGRGGETPPASASVGGGEEAPPHWWGEYRDGDKTLRIGNYREGPMGMYFACIFTTSRSDSGELTAAVSGREASGEGDLMFILSPDDSTVTVTVDAAEAGSEGNKTLTEWVGVYARQ